MSEEDINITRRLEYAKSGRAACKGKCKEKIEKGTLRYGTLTDFGGNESWAWRCLKCVTDRQAKNVVNEGIAVGYDQQVPEDVRATFRLYLDALATKDDSAKDHLETLLGAPVPEEEEKKTPKKAAKPKRPVEEILEDAERDGFSTLKMDDLKELLKSKKLKVSGKKDELVERAQEAYAE